MADTLNTTAGEAAGANASKLTPAAKDVTLKDLFLMEHGDWTSAPAGLTVKDIASLSDAFAGEHASAVHGVEAASSCSSSSIVCCCTAASEPAALIIL